MQKKSRTLDLENGFIVKITVKDTGSNYNQFASIFKEGNTIPFFGTCFKNTETNEKIVNWGNERINAPHNQIL